MKLGTKIVLGFVATNLIYVALSIFIFISAQPVREDAHSLSNDLLPMLNQASQVQYLVAMESARISDYSYNIQADTLLEALTYSADVVKYLWYLSTNINNSPVLQTPEIKSALGNLSSNYQNFRQMANLLSANLSTLNTSIENVTYGHKSFNGLLKELLDSEENALRIAANRGTAAEELNRRLDRISIIRQLEDTGNSLVINAIQARYANDLQAFEESRNAVVKLANLINELEKGISNDEGQQKIVELKKLIDISGTAVNLLEETLKTSNDNTDKRNELANNVIKYAVDLREVSDGLSQVVSSTASGTLNTVIISLTIGVITALVLSLVLGLVLTRGITKPINNLIIQLSDGAQEVGKASTDLSSSSNNLAAGAKDNAASLEEISAALEELSSMTSRNADHSVEANNLMAQAANEVGAAEESMTKVITAMQEIESSGNEIAKIIKTIDEIAFQTNLLALNAAVEAARAGEAGAGFAVVADEVRNLATRSAEAAKNTADLIDATISNITIGSEMVNQTAANFNHVGERTGKVAQLVGEVAEASKEQSQGIGQINDSMNAMDKVTQSNAVFADESATAAQNLSHQADGLLTAVDELSGLIHGGNTLPINGEVVRSRKLLS